MAAFGDTPGFDFTRKDMPEVDSRPLTKNSVEALDARPRRCGAETDATPAFARSLTAPARLSFAAPGTPPPAKPRAETVLVSRSVGATAAAETKPVAGLILAALDSGRRPYATDASDQPVWADSRGVGTAGVVLFTREVRRDSLIRRYPDAHEDPEAFADEAWRRQGIRDAWETREAPPRAESSHGAPGGRLIQVELILLCASRRTNPAVRRCKDEQRRCSYGRKQKGARAAENRKAPAGTASGTRLPARRSRAKSGASTRGTRRGRSSTASAPRR